MLITASPESAATVGAVELRVLEPGDADSLLEIFAGLGPRSREQRFLTPKTRLTGSELRRLTAVDSRDHVAVLAVAATDHRPVGVGRFVRDPHQPDSADVAVSVVDAWQRRGIGTLITNALARRALDVGVRRFTLVMQWDNEAARCLAHHGARVTRLGAWSGAVELAVTLDVG
ncbi:MAG TPA: GNAT family N-acetyltransferase [Nocardioides sp.]|jgi:RimJ/RimL family protein N-acetyltransferase|nr:GNAT family N-acetyltransferase [Nocardioides sp.]